MSFIAGHVLCRMQGARERRPKYNENRVLAVKKPRSSCKMKCYFSQLGHKFEAHQNNEFRPAINESQPL